MTSLELIKILSKPWANVNDIRKIASCGRDKASNIRDEIASTIIKEGKKLPISRSKIVPMENVIEYFNLNLEHIAFMSEKEKSLKI